MIRNLVCIFVLIVMLPVMQAFALGLEKTLPDPAQETRAQVLFHQIRCVVCQSEAIADSPADVAGDIRRLIRERISAGESDEQIKAYLVAQYGEFILMTPRLSQSTALLWFGPFLLLLAGALFAWRTFKSYSNTRKLP